MKLNKNFLVHNSGAETVLVPTAEAGFSGVVRGNSSFSAILELLGSDTTVERMVDQMCARFDAPVSVIEADVKRAVEQLRKIGAIDE